MRLSDLGPGEHAELGAFYATHIHHKLLAMGFRAGASVVLLSKMPFKGNMVVKIGARSVALRYTEASQIEVHKIG